MSGRKSQEPFDEGVAAPRVVSEGFHERVFAVVRQVPPGRVTTYGRVAALLGHGGVARHVGNALAACGHSPCAVPWHRVVNARGMISTRGQLQRELLEREGVRFTAHGAVALTEHLWAGPLAAEGG